VFNIYGHDMLKDKTIPESQASSIN